VPIFKASRKRVTAMQAATFNTAACARFW